MKYYRKIGILAVVAIGIAAMMIPGGSLVSRAFADGVRGSASADFNTQSNSASNSATVHISNGGHNDSDNKSGHSDNKDHKSGGKISHSGKVDQSISQSNSISASNTGSTGHGHPTGAPVRTDAVSGGSASADFNTQSNTATNTADVDIHNHGGKISHSGNVDQSITQSNDMQVSNSGSSSDGIATALELIIPSADASFNTQSNDATNFADVDISGHHDSIRHSGNVEQSILQFNFINATSTDTSGHTVPGG